jgi:hypothetical protein
MTNVAGIRYVLPGMTVFTHIHLHNFIRVPSETVYFDRWSFGFPLNVPMAFCAFHLSHHHMSRMGEENVVWLPGIGNPGNLFFRFHILRNQLRLVLGFTHLFWMAFDAGRQLWLASVRSILTKEVAILANQARLFLVDGVIVVDRLVLGGIEKLGKNYPTNEEGTSEAKDKENPTQ